MLLRSIGVPTPEGRAVENAEDAWETAEDIGLPVVVKPQYGNHGRGVATNLQSREQVIAAYAAAREEGRSIVVERHAPGDDYRLLVIGGKLVAAARREPAHVIGDGRLTVQQLIDIVNKDPRRSDGHSTALSLIKIDAVALGVLLEQGMTPDTIPALGKKVLIRRNANLSTGGTATDITDAVHPDVARHAIEAARIVGLDIAGVDVVAPSYAIKAQADSEGGRKRVEIPNGVDSPGSMAENRECRLLEAREPGRGKHEFVNFDHPGCELQAHDRPIAGAGAQAPFDAGPHQSEVGAKAHSEGGRGRLSAGQSGVSNEYPSEELHGRRTILALCKNIKPN